jgi:hypothetical protein
VDANTFIPALWAYYIMLQRSVPQIAALQWSIAGHSVPHAANAVQAFSLPSDVATPMANEGSQWLAMAIAHSECQSRFDSLMLNHGVTFLPPAGQVNSLRMCRVYYRTRRNLRVRRKISGAIGQVTTEGGVVDGTFLERRANSLFLF